MFLNRLLFHKLALQAKQKRESTNHSMKVAVVIGRRSLINQAAGKPVASVTKPMILKVHSGPREMIKPFTANVMIVPPSPPPA